MRKYSGENFDAHDGVFLAMSGRQVGGGVAFAFFDLQCLD